MARTLLLPFALLMLFTAQAQTYFYISEIAVTPANPTTSDNVSIQLIGDLSDTGAYIENVQAGVTGNTVHLTVVANSDGGLTVIVPHTETIVLGQLPAGTYTIEFTDATVGVLDLAPPEQHVFIVSGGGDPCNDVDISVQWHAFTDTAIVVHVLNNSTELFSYPNFILYDAQGDTLAKETVGFFGIGQESWHVLRVMDGATIPDVPFTGTLELWTGFTTELACTWSGTYDLCPPPPCATIIPYIQNIGGAIPIGTFGWTLYHEDEAVATGQFELNELQEFDADTLCLPPGHYAMHVLPDQEPTGGWPVFGTLVEGWIGGPVQDVYSVLPVLLPVPFYLPCADGTTSVQDLDPAMLLVATHPGGILVQHPGHAPLGPVWLFDTQGRLLFSTRASTDRLFVPIATPGVYLLRAGDALVKVVGGVE